MKVRLKKYGDLFISRPSAHKVLKAILPEVKKRKKGEYIELDFSRVITAGPSFVDEIRQLLEKRKLPFLFLPTKNGAIQSTFEQLHSLEEEKRLEKASEKGRHGWRMCPAGKYWVSSHPRQVPPSRLHPDGITGVRGHCRTNPSHKDSIYPEEIREMLARYQPKQEDLPTSFRRSKEFPQAPQWDLAIAFATRYWNEVLHPQEALPANVVKALIASESSFDPQPKRTKAIGLMQLMPLTIKILDDHKGELKDHLVHLTREQARDPVSNIFAGVRWLFYQQQVASRWLGRNASWEETIAKYKGYWKLSVPLRNALQEPGLKTFRKHLGELTKK